ncbi:MAG: molecular chaperone HtpG [Cytophagales bacterium]|nr:molecular chaperone HtpG [Cytophagales bacterium]
MAEKGSISIHSENIFPIIKKFLYSDNEIFLRELVSNAVDATQKIKHLSAMNQYTGELGELKVVVKIDKEAKTITISDKGLGMTADEIKKYINQIAFSGATDFVEKFKDSNPDRNQIIGNFGLGFYSAYMVADRVEIITKSYQDAPAAHWECDGSTEYSIDTADKAERGTDIILHISEEGEEFLEEARIQGILDKYGKFLPIEIEFNEKVVNNPSPLWVKSPSDLKDEDYINFYKELYPMAEEPLFWIHLNVDYPFNLTGVLYFPKIKNDFDVQKNKIHLYSRQVFITDEVKDVVPEFLTLLHGVIDSPDIPLNVSRSFLQADGNVRKINSHITKKVADKLNSLFKEDRKAYEEKWDDIHVFVKYGMITDEKFYDRVNKNCLLKNTEGVYTTLEEYKDKIKGNQTDKEENVVALYTNDSAAQHTYIQSAINKGYDVLDLNHVIDSHFIGQVEQKSEKFQLKRVDSDNADKIIDKDEKIESVLSEEETTQVKEGFEKVINDTTRAVTVESLSPDEFPVSVLQPEFMRRMQEMSMANGMGGMMPSQYNVVVNANHPIIQKVLKSEDQGEKDALIKQSYDLALLSQGLLEGEDLTKFIQRSIELV